MEIWKDVLGYEGYYRISNTGKLQSVSRNIYLYFKNRPRKPHTLSGRIMACSNAGRGYASAMLSKNGVSKRLLVHRLVAIAFIPNPFNLPQVNHIDGVKANNNVSNLEWCSANENINHALRMGLNGPDFKNCKVCIMKVDFKGNIISTYKSIRDAADVHGVSSSAISNASRKPGRSSCGFKWVRKAIDISKTKISSRLEVTHA